jgi:hypothetical protein
VLLLVTIVAACEEVGAPDAYRTQVCSVVRALAGPLPTAVSGIQTAAAAGDLTAAGAAVDAVDTIVGQINANLVDVPLWQTGAPAVSDLRAIGGAYRTAVAGLRTAIASGDKAQVASAVDALVAARDVAPSLADSLHQARVKGLNC